VPSEGSLLSEPFRDDSHLEGRGFPLLRVKVVVSLIPETAVPVFHLKDQLSILQGLKNPIAWTGHFRGSPARWKPSDGEAIVRALLEAQANPIVRPVDPAKLARRPRALSTKIGPVTVPPGEVEAEQLTPETTATSSTFLLLPCPSLQIFQEPRRITCPTLEHPIR
jgi:hypothetical protein